MNYSPSIIAFFNNQLKKKTSELLYIFNLLWVFVGRCFFQRKLFISNDVTSDTDTESHTFTEPYYIVNTETPVDRFAAFAAFYQPFRRHLNAALLPSYVNAAQTVEVIHGNRGAATNR